MYQEIVLNVLPEEANDNLIIRNKIIESFNDLPEAFEYKKIKQSIDARGKSIFYRLQIAVYPNGILPPNIHYSLNDFPKVNEKKVAIIVGAGPAGMFAALRLLELGIKPIVIERGKDVRARRRDLAAINKEQIVNSESNYCFGEGGAGTYSDGKLYTRSKKRGDINRILEILVAHGANNDILFEAHPHIGTNKLPNVVVAIRNNIIEKGGEILFNTKVTDFVLANNKIKGVIVNNELELKGIGVILATGHSAKDIFELCHTNKIIIEAKPFAIGVRVEHPQKMVDTAQYNLENRGNILPAAAYSLVSQTKYKGVQKGVFSFCMCPGGFIVPAATAEGEIVVNGMSPSKRDSKYANSGIVVSVDENDWKNYNEHGPLAALYYQSALEKAACKYTGGKQLAPSQLINDFIAKKESKELNPTSYQPGLFNSNFFDILPENIAYPLQSGLFDFGKKIKGFSSSDGQIIGIESRTSSPVRIPRNKETLEHVNTKALYPCGEGAGYAGGIVSAAMDGERCAEKLFETYGL